MKVSPANISHACPSSTFVAESGHIRYLNYYYFQTDLPVFQLPRMKSSVLSSGEILLLNQKTHCSSMFCPGACQSSNSGTRRPRPRWLLIYIIALLCHAYFHLVILSLFALAPLSFISTIKFDEKNIQVIAFCCTFFQVFNIPVFWPILVMYFITLFCITMKRQIKVNIILNVVSSKMKW